MTHKPTIDGVPLELLQIIEMTWRQASGFSNTANDAIAKGLGELRALLESPLRVGSKACDPCNWSDAQVMDFMGVALRNVDLVGTVRLGEIRQGFEYMRDRSPSAPTKPVEPPTFSAVANAHEFAGRPPPTAEENARINAMLDRLFNPAEQPAPTAASPLEIPEECPHLIVFDDADRQQLMFAGTGARQAALKTWEQVSNSWNAHLFVRVERNSRDDRYPSATAVSAGEPVTLASVAVLRDDGDGGLEPEWLLEGGTAELVEGTLLLVADDHSLCAEDGHAELYRGAPGVEA